MSLFSYNKGYQENRDRQETVHHFGKRVSFRCECFGREKVNAKLLGQKTGTRLLTGALPEPFNSNCPSRSRLEVLLKSSSFCSF